MKSKPLKYFTVIAITAIFLVMTLGFITADKKPEMKNIVFIKCVMIKENI